MRQFKHSVALLLLLAVAPSLFAQKQRSQEFKDKYTLSEAVILSRHNIRAPLSTKGSLLEKSPHTPGSHGPLAQANSPHEVAHWKISSASTSVNGPSMQASSRKTQTPRKTK